MDKDLLSKEYESRKNSKKEEEVFERLKEEKEEKEEYIFIDEVPTDTLEDSDKKFQGFLNAARNSLSERRVMPLTLGNYAKLGDSLEKIANHPRESNTISAKMADFWMSGIPRPEVKKETYDFAVLTRQDALTIAGTTGDEAHSKYLLEAKKEIMKEIKYSINSNRLSVKVFNGNHLILKEVGSWLDDLGYTTYLELADHSLEITWE